MKIENLALFEELVTKEMSCANMERMVSLYQQFSNYILIEYIAYSIDQDTKIALTKSLNRIFAYYVKEWGEEIENENNYQE